MTPTAREDNRAASILDMIIRLEEIYRTRGNAPLTHTPDGFNDYPITIEKTERGYRLKAATA